MTVELFRLRAATCLMAVSLFAGLALQVAPADSLAPPQGRVILTVTGSITHTNVEDRADFDMAMLQAMPAHTIETSTPWTEGVAKFEGVLARDLMSAVGVQGEHVIAVALNDYQFKIPLSDFEQYRVLIAYRMNDKRMRIRDKGPLWIVYPMDDHQSLQNELTHSKMIWQLRRLVVE